VLWGIAQGVAIVFALAWGRYLPSPPRPLSWMATIGFFLLSGIIFRTATLGAAWRIFSGLATFPDLRQTGAGTLAVAAACAVLLPSSRRLADRLNERPQAVVAMLLGLAGVAILVQLGSEQTYEFIYFQF
jgi:hypothetical protein